LLAVFYVFIEEKSTQRTNMSPRNNRKKHTKTKNKPQLLIDFDESPSTNEQVRYKPKKLKRDIVVDWDDDDLFGDDDACFVDIDALTSFSIVRSDCKKFFSIKSKFIAINAPKGSGKTTMCRLLTHELNNSSNDVAIWLKDAEISPRPETPLLLNDWIYRWTNHISYAVLCMLVKHNLATLITDADLADIYGIQTASGEIKKSLLDQFLSAFKIPFIKDKKIPDKFALSFTDMLTRVDSRLKHKAWIFIDEVDQGFSNDIQLINKNAAALIACRELVPKLKNILIRSTIRPNVLAVLQSKVDSIANVADSIVDLDWTSLQIRGVVAKRVESYLDRNNYHYMDTFTTLDEKEDWLLAQILKVEDPEFDLGHASRPRPVHITLSILGKNRPRWVLNLLKKSAQIAKENKETLITPAELFGALTKYGNERIKNMASEFGSVCEQLEFLIDKFSLSKRKYFYHSELLDFISKNITDGNDITISGLPNKASAIDVAGLLYEIGLLDAAYISGESSLKSKERLKKTHMDFYSKPSLMAAMGNTGEQVEKFVWEIHPAFRYSLGLERKKWRSRR